MIFRGKDIYKCESLHKSKKDGKTYVLHTSDKANMTVALAIGHDGAPIIGCDPKDFVLVISK